MEAMTALIASSISQWIYISNSPAYTLKCNQMDGNWSNPFRQISLRAVEGASASSNCGQNGSIFGQQYNFSLSEARMNIGRCKGTPKP